MTQVKLASLVKQIDSALAKSYEAQRTNDPNPPQDIYHLAEEAEELGLGAVQVHTSSGRLGWFDLANLEF